MSTLRAVVTLPLAGVVTLLSIVTFSPPPPPRPSLCAMSVLEEAGHGSGWEQVLRPSGIPARTADRVWEECIQPHIPPLETVGDRPNSPRRLH